MKDGNPGARRFVLLALSMLLAAAMWPSQAAATVTMTLSASPVSGTAGQPVTITATISDTKHAAVSGTVKFSDLNQVWTGPTCNSVPVAHVGSAYQATCNTSFGETGDNQIDAQYSGPNGFYATYIDYQVAGEPTMTTLTSDAPSPVTGNTFTLTATITPSQADSTPMVGWVQFSDNGSVVQTCGSNELDGNVHVGEVNAKPPYVAMCDITYNHPGSHVFTALFHRDSHYADSRSAPLTLQVHAGGGSVLANCPGQDQPFSSTDPTSARNALICLINEVRANYGLNALEETALLDGAAQDHPLVGAELRNGMFAPAVLADPLGDTTPYAAVATMMANRNECYAMLNQLDQIGAGVVADAVTPRPRRNQIVWAAAPTWTVEMLATQAAAPINTSAQDHCPHPLSSDAAGQRGVRLRVVPKTHGSTRSPFGLYLFGWKPVRRGLELFLMGVSKRPVSATLTVSMGSGSAAAVRTLRVRRLRHGHLKQRLVRLPHRSLRATRVLTLWVTERAPRKQRFVFKGGL